MSQCRPNFNENFNESEHQWVTMSHWCSSSTVVALPEMSRDEQSSARVKFEQISLFYLRGFWNLLQQKVSEPCRNRTQVAWLNATHLNHTAIGSCQFTEENCIWPVILLEVFCNLQLLFGMHNCQSLIAQVESQGQARNTRILESKPFIDTFDIDWSWNFFT